MDWETYYDRFYYWAESTQINRISSLTSFGASSEVAEIAIALFDEKAASRLIRKAVDYGVQFTPDEIYDLSSCCDTASMNALLDASECRFTQEQLERLWGAADDDVLARAAKRCGVALFGDTEDELDEEEYKPDEYKRNSNGGVPMGAYSKVVDIRLLDVEDSGSKVMISYVQIYEDGSKKTVRRNVKDLSCCPALFTANKVSAAECLGKVYCGMIKSDVRTLFIIRLNDGSAELVQEKEGSRGCLKLLQVCEETENDTNNNTVSRPAPEAPEAPAKAAEPYTLRKNELPQGTYLVGRDIPPGTYDFFVVYGDGGNFEIFKPDPNGKFTYDAWRHSYWVGLKKEYEHRELIHVFCPEGYTVRITGNVILKIAKSQSVRIEL